MTVPPEIERSGTRPGRSGGRRGIAFATVTLAAYATAALAPAPGDVEPGFQGLERAAELDPDDPETLLGLADHWKKTGDPDRELACLLRALDAIEATESEHTEDVSRRMRSVERRVRALDDAGARLTTYRDRYLRDLTWALELYAGNQKKPRNALEVAGRILRYRPDHPTANRVVERILEDAGEDLRLEAERLLAERERALPRATRVEWLRRHGTWQNAGSVETRGYVVHTDIGYDTLHTAASALEQAARHYRAFYGVTDWRQTRRTEVFLTRTRDEFESICGVPDIERRPTLRGFLRQQKRLSRTPGEPKQVHYEFELFSYDPRDEGFPRDRLFRTLFHEASHQYMALATGWFEPPSWFNEGMSCYFEGARLSPDGRVAVGLPAPERLGSLYRALPSAGILLRNALVAEPIRGEHYPVAWGIVYFLFHHQDDDGGFPYRPLLYQAIARCAQGEIAGDVLFEHVVLAGTGWSRDEFLSRWTNAVEQWWEREREPAAAARFFRERGAVWLDDGREEAARDGFENALLRDPDDALSMLGLARIHMEEDDPSLRDEVLLWARRAYAAAARRGAEQVRDQAAAVARGADKAGFDRIRRAEERYREAIWKHTHRLADGGRPRSALAVLYRYLDRVLGENNHDAFADELRQRGVLDLRRTLRVFDGETLDNLSASPSRFRVEDSTLIGTVELPHRAPVFVEEPVAPRFRLEGEVWFGDGNVVIAFCAAGADRGGTVGFAARPTKAGTNVPAFAPFGRVPNGAVGSIQEGFDESRKFEDFLLGDTAPMAIELPAGAWVPFALERDRLDRLALYLAGARVAERTLHPLRSGVRPGLILYGGEARARDLRVVEWNRP